MDDAETIRLRHAERAHDGADESGRVHADAILSFSNAAMRAPAIAAAGGIAAALGFYSANFERLSAASLSAFNEVLIWMFGSILLAVVAPSFAYFSQLFYADAIANQQYTWTHPYILATRGSRVRVIIGNFFRFATYGLVTASIVGLLIGGLAFLRLVSSVGFSE